MGTPPASPTSSRASPLATKRLTNAEAAEREKAPREEIAQLRREAYSRFDTTDAKIDELRKEMNARFDALYAEINRRFDELYKLFITLVTAFTQKRQES